MSAGSYTPPARGLDGHELAVQPDRFARTGMGLYHGGIRSEFWSEAHDCIDAPPLVPRGSVRCLLQVPVISGLSPWHYLDAADSREAS